MHERETVTRLLDQAAAGHGSAAAELLPIVYDELRRIAGSYFQRERADHTLQPTALVHEAYVRLAKQDATGWESRRHFFALAARAMRNLLVDHARARERDKRGGGWHKVTLQAAGGTDAPHPVDLIALDDALRRLRELDERKADLVELRYFGGLDLDEAASALGIARSTASETWRMARAWLFRELGGRE